MTTPPRFIPHLVGEARVGPSMREIPGTGSLFRLGTKWASLFTLTAPTRIVKLTLACDGGGATSGGFPVPPSTPDAVAKIRGVIYQNGTLLGWGSEVIVEYGDPLRWIDLPLFDANTDGVLADPLTYLPDDGNPVLISAGTVPIFPPHGVEKSPAGVLCQAGPVEFGFIVGGNYYVLRVAEFNPDSAFPGGSRWVADTYSIDTGENGGDSVRSYGPSPFFEYAWAGNDVNGNPTQGTHHTPTLLNSTFSIFGTTYDSWTPPDATKPEVLAALGWTDAQTALTGPIDGTVTYRTTATWHGTQVDDHKGAFAVVSASGALAGLVGKTLQVSTRGYRPRSCFVYVYAAVSQLDQDISLARRAFSTLGLLSLDDLDVDVKVLL